MNDRQKKWLAELAEGSIWASRTWWVNGMMADFAALGDEGFAVCIDRDGAPASPLEDLARWTITDKGRSALIAA